jgi:hypothetical protein
MSTSSRSPVASLSLLVAGLLVASAALFAVGVLIETGGSGRSEPVQTIQASSHGEASEGGEGAGQHQDEAGGGESTGEVGESEVERAAEQGAAHDESAEERILGVPIESPLTVIGAVLVSILLAVAVWRRPLRAVLIVAAVFALGAAVLDVAEIVHQTGEGSVLIAALAGLVALLHVAVVAGVAMVWGRTGAASTVRGGTT